MDGSAKYGVVEDGLVVRRTRPEIVGAYSSFVVDNDLSINCRIPLPAIPTLVVMKTLNLEYATIDCEVAIRKPTNAFKSILQILPFLRRRWQLDHLF
jgi:hypothetical protein